MNNTTIPTSVIEQDILDTEREIAQMTREAEGLALIGDKMSMFKRDARLSGVAERTRFVIKLRAILLERGE